jgi:excisionase family DNA binding protein
VPPPSPIEFGGILSLIYSEGNESINYKRVRYFAVRLKEGMVLNVEIRFVVAGQELSLSSFAEALVREVRQLVREEMNRTLAQPTKSPMSTQNLDSKVPPQAVSVREAARLLSISPRTVDKYIALKVIRHVRVGRRVLIPMRSLNEIVSTGIPSSRRAKMNGEKLG